MRRTLGALALVTFTTAACAPGVGQRDTDPSLGPAVAASKALDDAIASLRSGAEILAVATATGDDPVTTRIQIASDGTYASTSATNESGTQHLEQIASEGSVWLRAPLRDSCWIKDPFPTAQNWSANEFNPATSTLSRIETPRWADGDIEFETPSSVLAALYPSLADAFLPDPENLRAKVPRLTMRAHIESGVLSRISADSKALTEIARSKNFTAARELSTLREGSVEITYEKRAEAIRPAVPTDLCPS